MVLGENGGRAFRWEERGNRWYETGYLSGSLTAPWNREYMFHPAHTDDGTYLHINISLKIVQ